MHTYNIFTMQIDLSYSFLRCSKFSSFNQTLDDSDQWTAFAPIAKLESLDELDQVMKSISIQTTIL